MDEMNGTPGLGVMVHGVDQMLADKRAAQSYRREKSLMAMQNAMNISNAKSMPSIQAEGLRMAGFNPAMINGAGTSAAPTVSKGSADMAQTLPFDVGGIAQLMLLDAQRKNIEAQTEKTKAEANVTKWDEVPNKQSSTAVNTANAIKQGADAVRIQNDNEAFEDENTRLGEFGPAMADKWMHEPWFKALSPDSKATIEAIADGTIPLTVGGMRAFAKVVAAQKDLSDADRSMVDNAFANAITEAMWKNDKVTEALALLPVTQQAEAQSRTAKNLVETGILHIEKLNKADQREVYLNQDPDKLYLEYQKNPSLDNLVKWLTATVNDKLNRAVEKVAPAAVGGYGAGRGMEAGRSASNPMKGWSRAPGMPDVTKDPNDPHGIHRMFEKFRKK